MSGNDILDVDLCQILANLVEKLTTSGHSTLDNVQMKEIKKICKKSDEYVKHCFYQCMMQLEKPHSEIRLSSFLIIDELFNRSHCFRELLLQDFQNFMELTLEIDPVVPLPPPKQTAKILKRKVIRVIHQWNIKFGNVYKKLSLAYNFLKQCKKIDFESMEARSEVERRRAEELRIRAEAQEKEKVENASKELSEMKEEIKNCLIQAESCLSLLLPEPETFNINGLQSPDPHRTTNPWKDCSSRRKSTDASKIKKSKTIAESNSMQKDNPCVIGENLKEIVKLEKCDNCGKFISESESVLTNSDNTTENKDLCLCKTELDKSDNDSGEKALKQSASSIVNHSVADDDSDDFHEITDDESESSDNEENDNYNDIKHEFTSPVFDIARQHGLGSHQYSLNIEVTPGLIHINETTDNEDVINALKDSVQLAQNKFLPSLQKWLEVFTKAGKQELIRRILDIREAIENMKNKIEQIKFVKIRKIEPTHRLSIKSENSDESDDDFEEVADSEMKEGYEPDIPEDLREEYGLIEKVKKPTEHQWSVKDSISQLADEADPTTYKATLLKIKESIQKSNKDNQFTSTVSVNPSKSSSETTVSNSTPSSSSVSARSLSNSTPCSSTSMPSSSTSAPREDLKIKAPFIPFNTDLLNWGEKLEAPLMQKIESGHRFWFNKEIEEPVVDKTALSSLTSRMINFTGKFEPVKHRCNAPLPSGKLCPRMDRVKCPFHGKIIARDAVGNPTNPEDRIRLQEEQEKKQQESTPEWEDPELQQAIQAATGVDVSRKGKGKGGKGKRKGKKKYPNLTDIGPKPKTSRERLEAKIFNERTMKRVASKLDDMEFKRHKDKFANQFNYAYKSTVG